MIGGHRLDDHGGDGRAFAGKQIPQRLLIIQGQHARGGHEACGTPAEEAVPKVASPEPAATSR